MQYISFVLSFNSNIKINSIQIYSILQILFQDMTKIHVQDSKLCGTADRDYLNISRSLSQ